jgi:hypothetical protein
VVEEDILLEEIENKKNSLSTERMDMSFGEIMNMYRTGEIIIDPEFQRLFRWSKYQQTRFIESLLLGIPIPPIFVAEDENGRWELVDGLQRISTVFSFFGMLEDIPQGDNNWKLEKGELINKFEGFKCDELPLKLQYNLKRSVCRIEIIRWDNEFIDMRYELFNRLNTGGSELKDQEIRNCVFRGPSNDFNRFLSREARNPMFINLISPSDRQIRELYLDELILRFCSLYGNAESVNTNISQHMTDFMKEAVKEPEKISFYETILHRTLDLLSPRGKDIFRGSNYNFSSSLYDGIMIGVSQNIDKYESESENYLINKISELRDNRDFIKASGSGSASKTRIMKRLIIAQEVFARD